MLAAVRRADQSPSGAITNNVFYLSGVGGSGKTYTYKCLYHALLREHKKVLCCCFTGIGALLLPRGCTAHYAFRLPLNVTKESVSSMKLDSHQAMLLKDTAVIIIDEVSMISKLYLEVCYF